jgi:hypothetical protein
MIPSTGQAEVSRDAPAVKGNKSSRKKDPRIRILNDIVVWVWFLLAFLYPQYLPILPAFPGGISLGPLLCIVALWFFFSVHILGEESGLRAYWRFLDVRAFCRTQSGVGFQPAKSRKLAVNPVF